MGEEEVSCCQRCGGPSGHGVRVSARVWRRHESGGPRLAHARTLALEYCVPCSWVICVWGAQRACFSMLLSGPVTFAEREREVRRERDRGIYYVTTVTVCVCVLGSCLCATRW